MKQTEISPQIIDYVEREIIPRYAAFDKAHREDHVRMVIEQSMKLIEHEPSINVDMVYVVAAFHDLGLVNGRENHHKDSRKILEADTFIASHFSPEQIRFMGEAVEDHRASNGTKPRNEYGLIVAEADRFIDPETIIRRTIQYGLANYPQLNRAGHYQRIIDHLFNKYGPNGYLKVWIPWSDNAANLKRLHILLTDQSLLDEIFNRIFDEETKLN
ncbi:MAG: HD domain-containing protein [Muribaculaceae bacterium]